MSRAEKIERLVQSRLNRMDLADLESFYVDVKTEEFEDYPEELLDEILAEELENE